MEDLDRAFAYVSHATRSLRNSCVVHVSPLEKKISIFAWKDGSPRVDVRVEWTALKEKTAHEALSSFCQIVYLHDIVVNHGTLGIAGLVAQNLFEASSENGTFNREELSLGIRALQELDWAKQNEDLGVRQSEKTVHRDRVLFGPDDRFVMETDTAMLDSLGLVKFKLHDLDIGQQWSKKSYQLFVDVNDSSFVKAFEESTRTATWATFGSIARLGLIIFEEAAAFMKNPCCRTPKSLLQENVERGEFLRDSNRWETNSEIQITFLDALDDTNDLENEEVRATAAQRDPKSDFVSTPSPSSSLSQESPQSFSPSSLANETATAAPSTDDMDLTQEKADKATKKRLKKQVQKAKRREKIANAKAAQLTNETEVELPADLSGMKITVPASSSTCSGEVSEKGIVRNAEATTEALVGENATDTDVKAQEKPVSVVESLEEDTSEVTSNISNDSDQTITQATLVDSNARADVPQQPPQVEPSANINAMTAAPTITITVASPGQSQMLGQMASVPATFKFDGFHPRLTCPKPDCGRMTSCWDSVVVICPACGTDSYTRYCRKAHLYEDIQRHWLYECCKNAIEGPVDRLTIRHSQLPRTAYITGHFTNHIERHRQAVYRAMETADFFVFDDHLHLPDGVPTKEDWNLVRGVGKMVKALTFPNDGSSLSAHAFFNHHIQQCLKFGGPMALNSCNIAFHMIRDLMIMDGTWSEDVLTGLCMQLAFEWCYKVPEHFYNVDFVNVTYRVYGLLPPPLPFQHV